MNDELLPCPFCGSPAVLRNSARHHSCVECPDCCAAIYDSPEQAIAAWNRRSAHAAGLSEMDAIVKEDLVVAEMFSDIIHLLERRGVELNRGEDRAWQRATEACERFRLRLDEVASERDDGWQPEAGLIARLRGDTLLNPLVEIRRALSAAQSAIKSRERWSEGMANCFDGAFKALDELDASFALPATPDPKDTTRS